MGKPIRIQRKRTKDWKNLVTLMFYLKLLIEIDYGIDDSTSI